MMGCKAQTYIDINNKKIKLSEQEFEEILQESFNLNYLDDLFTESEKSDGIVIVINEFIKPHYQKLNLFKFGKKIKFKTHEEIYQSRNEKFFDVLDFSIILNNDTLNIVIGLRYKYTALSAQFKKVDDKWVILNKNNNSISKNKPIYNFKIDKEQCLAEQIKELNHYPNFNKCLKYKF